MLIPLLLSAFLTPAATEWVEISQNHYKKPARTNLYPKVKDGPTPYTNDDVELAHHFTKGEDLRFLPNFHKNSVRITQNFPLEETTVRLQNFRSQYEDSIYTNHSISEYNWNLNKNQAFSNIKSADDKVKFNANITPEFSLEIYEPVVGNPTLVTRNTPNDHDKVSATIERLPSKGVVKRVQLSNTPVKSPSVTNSVPEIQSIRISDLRNRETFLVRPDAGYNGDEYDKTDKTHNSRNQIIGLPTQDGVNLSFSDPNEALHMHTSGKITPVSKYDRIMNSSTNGTTDNLQKTPLRRYQSKPEEEMDRSNKTNTIKDSLMLHSDLESSISFQNTQRNAAEDTIKDKPKYGSIKNKDTGQKNKGDFEEVIISNDHKNIVDEEVIPIQQHKPNLQLSKHPHQNDHAPSDDDDEKQTNEMKKNTIEKLMTFMKVIADTISKNSNRGVNGKVKYLNELKDTLLHNIKQRIDATWPDDDTSSPTRRHSRAASARGHVEFPSSESALMTISFLTFAVFLIKLVLQVIQTYKNKTMIMAPLVVATAGRTITTLRTSN